MEDLLPDKYRDKASEYEKGTDTMDVWFDSGINNIVLELFNLCQHYLTLLYNKYFHILYSLIIT